MTKRNVTWLWQGFDAQGCLVGELEGANADHALDEFAHMFDVEVTSVKRVQGSGRPHMLPAPCPGTARWLVRYVGVDGKRHKVKVRTISANAAKQLLTTSVHVTGSGRVTSVKQVTPFA